MLQHGWHVFVLSHCKRVISKQSLIILKFSFVQIVIYVKHLLAACCCSYEAAARPLKQGYRSTQLIKLLQTC